MFNDTIKVFKRSVVNHEHIIDDTPIILENCHCELNNGERLGENVANDYSLKIVLSDINTDIETMDKVEFMNIIYTVQSIGYTQYGFDENLKNTIIKAK